MDDNKGFSVMRFEQPCLIYHLYFTLAYNRHYYLMFIHFSGRNWWVSHHEVEHFCVSVLAGCSHDGRPNVPTASIIE